MSARFDHSDAADIWIDNAVRAQASNQPETLSVAYAGIAQAHATLALVEQHRIANLIAFGALNRGNAATVNLHIEEITKALGLA